MSPDFKFKNKWLVAVLALAFTGTVHAEDRPKLSYAPPVAAAPSTSSAAPAVAAAPATSTAAAQAKAPAHIVRHAVSHVHKRIRHHRVIRKHVAKPHEDKVTYSPPLPNEYVVSDRDFNDFIFSSPITDGPIMPAGVPLVGKPVYLANNTQVMLQFEKGYSKPMQVVVETQDGKVHKLYLRARPIDGVTVRVDGAREQVASSNAISSAAGSKDADQQPGARAEDIELLKHFVQGDIPPEFESVNLPKPTRFDKFTVVPLSGWSNGNGLRVMVFSLVAAVGQTAVVAPPQFYRPGITAVLLTGDHVSENSTPQLYVVEETNDE